MTASHCPASTVSNTIRDGSIARGELSLLHSLGGVPHGGSLAMSFSVPGPDEDVGDVPVFSGTGFTTPLPWPAHEIAHSVTGRILMIGSRGIFETRRMLMAMAACLVLAGSAARGETPLRLVVSPLGDDAWTGQLDAPNPARSDGPLATLDGARTGCPETAQGRPGSWTRHDPGPWRFLRTGTGRSNSAPRMAAQPRRPSSTVPTLANDRSSGVVDGSPDSACTRATSSKPT